MKNIISNMNVKEFNIFNTFLYIFEILLILIVAFLAIQKNLDIKLYILIILGFVLLFKSIQKSISIFIYGILINDINIEKFEDFNRIFYKKPNLNVFNQWNKIYVNNRIAIEFYKGNFNESLNLIEELKKKRVSSNIKRSIISFEVLNKIFLGENINIDEYLEQLSRVKFSNKEKNDMDILKNNIRIYYDILIKKKASGSLIIKRESKLNKLFNLFIDMNKAYNLNWESQYESYRRELSKNNPQLYIVKKAKAGL